jgi:uncharacterized membrane protein YccF (DUF307 family)
MSLIGNIIWIVFGGLAIFLEYVAAGFALCLTIIGIPFGLQCFKLALLSLFPFGQEVVPTHTSDSGLSVLMNVLWLVLVGIWVAATHLFFAILLAITIIGLPFAKQHMKLVALALMPFGKTLVSRPRQRLQVIDPQPHGLRRA